ncbi:MAG: hypothetical protein HRU78_14370 [Gammaproteobacteria bacterium]|nr:MAG: hypothetical protein HRU78_14370 [Gammaproteobacteria bacterium]
MMIPAVHAGSKCFAGMTKYLIETGAFRNELCKGYDLKFAYRVLIERGWLTPGSDKAAQTLRISALGKATKVYVIDLTEQEGVSNE